MISVDWGTTSLRAYRFDAAGGVVEKRHAARGILTVPAGGFAHVLREEVGDWLAATDRVILSGMVGSRQGWLEAPYCACPAGVDELLAKLIPLQWDGPPAWIAPCLTCRDAAGVPDVMRGEETQLLGAMAQLGGGEYSVCLPGTHSKWARCTANRVQHFASYMTGEVYAVLRSHSILARSIDADDGGDAVWFDRGVARAAEAGGLLHHVFGLRASELFGDLQRESTAAYLSGMCIGHELLAAAPRGETIYLVGGAELAAWYERALGQLGRPCRVLDADLVVAGHRVLAGALT